jgi:hypothetical protein
MTGEVHMPRVHHHVLHPLHHWRGRKRKLGYRNYQPWQIMLAFIVLGVLCGLFIGSLNLKY